MPSPAPVVITHDQFNAAISDGDLETVQRYFALRHVRDQVYQTNLYIIATKPTSGFQFTQEDGTDAWFHRQERLWGGQRDVSLSHAAWRGHAHVMEWFFSHENAAWMGATLALLLPHVASFVRRSEDSNDSQNDTAMLETLLSSTVFSDYVADDMKQATLDAIAGDCRTPALVHVAIAHGASVNAALPAIARYGKRDFVAVLADAGACLVGANVVRGPLYAIEYVHIASYSRHGVDTRNLETLLLNAVDYACNERVAALVSTGHFDVDVRDDDGRTPLMHVAALDWTPTFGTERGNPTHSMALSLLELCDVHQIDHRGRTALHYAVQVNRSVANSLIRFGADATVRDHDGFTPVDYLQDPEYDGFEWSRIIRQYLKQDGDPFATPPARPVVVGDPSAARHSVVLTPATRSLHDRLLETDWGRRFIDKNPRFFHARGVVLE